MKKIIVYEFVREGSSGLRGFVINLKVRESTHPNHLVGRYFDTEWIKRLMQEGYTVTGLPMNPNLETKYGNFIGG